MPDPGWERRRDRLWWVGIAIAVAVVASTAQVVETLYARGGVLAWIGIVAIIAVGVFVIRVLVVRIFQFWDQTKR